MIELYGFIFTSILGTIGHFLYNFTKCKFFAFFFSHSEDLYSHLKLGTTPMLLWIIVEKSKIINNNIIYIKGCSMMLYIIIIAIVYLLGKLRKKEMLILNISSFYISCFLSYLLSFYLLNIIDLSFIIKFIGLLSFILIMLSYPILNYKYLIKH